MSYRNAPWMWADALALLHRAERLQRQFFHPGQTRAVWEPPVDVVESATGLDIAVALPGVAPERLQTGFADGVLVIEAVRPLPDWAARHVIRRLEIPYGRFERRISLPPGRYALVEQAFSNGCLHLRLEKRP